jgi:hypothetical protein
MCCFVLVHENDPVPGYCTCSRQLMAHRVTYRGANERADSRTWFILVEISVHALAGLVLGAASPAWRLRRGLTFRNLSLRESSLACATLPQMC